MSKKLNVDFYQVKISQPSALSFEEILQKIDNTLPHHRTKEVRLHHIYIFSIQYGWQDTWEGEIVRLRMNDLPVKGSLAGEIEDIQLAHDEGIGEQSAFIYHPATRILAIQSNRNGVSPGDFARYFEIFGEGNTSISLDPVLQMSALQKLVKLKEVINFEIKIASLSNMNIFGDNDNAVEEMIHLAEIFQAPSINIEVKTSVKKKQPSLLVDKVVETAQSLLRASQQKHNKITTLKVSGSDDEDNKTVIDLLKDKMRESINVNNPGRNRNIPYDIRQKALQEAWNNRLTEILRMFRS
ncbi:hypothetical protein NIES2107_10260 [Nostoc carneum NIES-2107]|nr:hypothetical protein NIES2107_10260 [Nostoc carneum NIES-2107]